MKCRIYLRWDVSRWMRAFVAQSLREEIYYEYEGEYKCCERQYLLESVKTIAIKIIT